MPRSLLALLASLALVAAACGSDSEDTAAEAAAETEEAMEDDAMEDDAMEDDAMEEASHSVLSIVAIDFDSGEVTIANSGDADVSLDGYFLCNFPSYGQVEAGVSVPAGGTVTVTSPVGLRAEDGELGLYTTDSYSDPSAIAAYVEWGSEGHERASVAVEAGIHDGTPTAVEGSALTVES